LNQTQRPDSCHELIDCIRGGWVLNQSRRIRHMECSANKSEAMNVTRIGNGWYYNCFRCGFAGFYPDETATAESAAKELDALSAREVMKSTPQIDLPSDFVKMRENPSEEGVPYSGYNWLWQYNLDEYDMKKFNIGWSDDHNRCIIPVYEYLDGRKLIGWVGRDCRNMTKEVRKKTGGAKYIIRKQQDYKRIFFHAPSKSDTYVIVEDIISAIKVNKIAGVHVYALLNTYVPPIMMLRLRRKRVILWLDNDQLSNMVATVQKATSLGSDMNYIHSALDPKGYGPDAIKIFIKEALK